MQSTAQNTKQKRRKRLRKAVQDPAHSHAKIKQASFQEDSDDGMDKQENIKIENKFKKLLTERN